nr:MAG TPA: hypothetical protein [Caudoviricetes sp.]
MQWRLLSMSTSRSKWTVRFDYVLATQIFI